MSTVLRPHWPVVLLLVPKRCTIWDEKHLVPSPVRGTRAARRNRTLRGYGPVCTGPVTVPSVPHEAN